MKRSTGGLTVRFVGLMVVVISMITGIQQVEAGSIAGTVTDSQTNDPLEDIRVTPYRWDDDYWYWEELYFSYVNTDANGEYQIGDLDPGFYKLEFKESSGNYVTAFNGGFSSEYDDGPEIEVESPLHDVTGIDIALVKGSSISGTITAADTNNPIEDAYIYAYLYRDGYWVYYDVAWTYGDGNYTLSGLPPGTYRIRTSVYVADYLTELYDGVLVNSPYDGGTDIVISQPDTHITGIDASLKKASFIRGHIVDASSGDPLNEYTYSIYTYQLNNGDWGYYAQEYAEEDGSYSIPVAPGTYRIEFWVSKWMDDEHISEVYNGYLEADPYEEGTEIVVSDFGIAVTNEVASLQKYGTISGRIVSQKDNQPVEDLTVFIHGTRLKAVTDANGEYTIEYVVPGAYELHTELNPGAGLLGAWYGNVIYGEQRNAPAGALQVTVASGATVANVNMTLAEGARLEGSLTGTDGEIDTGEVLVHNKFYGVSYVAQVTNGVYEIDGLLPGFYIIKATSEGYRTQWWGGTEHRTLASAFTMQSGLTTTRSFILHRGQGQAFARVSSHPIGLEIYLDMQPTGKYTPATINLGESGLKDANQNLLSERLITVGIDGYPTRQESRLITPVEGDVNVVAFNVLEGGHAGRIRVDSNPPGADVYMDVADRIAGTTDDLEPLVIEDLRPGQHVVLIRKAGYQHHKPVIAKVLAGETTEISVTLTPLAASGGINVQVNSPDEDEMEIYLDYLPTGHVTDSEIGVLDMTSPSGARWFAATHTIMLRKSGLEPFAPSFVNNEAETDVTVTRRSLLSVNQQSQTATTDVPVPHAWLDAYPEIMLEAEGDYEVAANTLTGKKDSSGHSLTVWEEYVAGTIPTDPDSIFYCEVEVVDGIPYINWVPDLEPFREYTIYGREELTEGNWQTPAPAGAHFFKVKVSLP